MAEENDQQYGAEGTDLSLSGIIEALDTGKPMSESKDSDTQPAFDPNATMNYQQAGMPYPELPFANEENEGAAVPHSGGAASSNRDEASHGVDVAARAGSEGSAPARGRIGNRLDELFGPRRPDAAQADQPRAARSAAAKTRRPTTATQTRTRTPHEPPSVSAYGDSGSNFRPVNMEKSSYRIRGGGHKQKLSINSPAFLGLIAILSVVGIGIFLFAYNSLSSSISEGSSGYDFDLSTSQTREAIDSRVPILVNYIDTSIDDAIAILSDAGQFVYANESYRPDSPDDSAEGREMLSMPQEMSSELMEGYYEGGYNAFSPEELAEYFNGAYAFDMARGDLGSWNKIRYVNLNATGIDDEMARLADLQELSGESVTISDQGTDSRGNKVIQGQKVIEGETILYFKIAACPFNSIYNAKTLSVNSVYVTCTVASYDFFTGSDTITPDSEPEADSGDEAEAGS